MPGREDLMAKQRSKIKSKRLRDALSNIGTYKDGKYVPAGKKKDPQKPLTAAIKKMGDTDKTVPTTSVKPKAKPKAPRIQRSKPQAGTTTKPAAKPAAKAKSEIEAAAKPTPSGSGTRGKPLPSNPQLKTQLKVGDMRGNKVWDGKKWVNFKSEGQIAKDQAAKKDKRPGTGVFPGSPEDKKKMDKPKPKSKFRGAGTTGSGGRRSSSGTRKPKPKTNTTPTKSGPMKGSIKAINGKMMKWSGSKWVQLKTK